MSSSGYPLWVTVWKTKRSNKNGCLWLSKYNRMGLGTCGWPCLHRTTHDSPILRFCVSRPLPQLRHVGGGCLRKLCVWGVRSVCSSGQIERKTRRRTIHRTLGTHEQSQTCKKKKKRRSVFEPVTINTQTCYGFDDGLYRTKSGPVLRWRDLLSRGLLYVFNPSQYEGIVTRLRKRRQTIEEPDFCFI